MDQIRDCGSKPPSTEVHCEGLVRYIYTRDRLLVDVKGFPREIDLHRTFDLAKQRDVTQKQALPYRNSETLILLSFSQT